jgi:predicted ATPase
VARRDLPRGTVTFLFTDIEGSTRLLHELGPAGYERALIEHRRVLRDAFLRHEGVEVDTQGDAFFVAFPTVRGAVDAAEQARQALAPGPISVRMGLHTGTPFVGEEGYVGADVNLGARIAAAGHGGQVLLSRTTREHVELDVEDLGEHRLKDFPEPVWIYQLGSERFPSLKTISNTNLPRPASSFVGRAREIAEVASLLRDGDRVVTLHGPGGAGKTRLAIEAAAELVPEFRNGVYWVGLATLRDPALVPETIAQTVGSRNGLAEHIGGRELLLLLDNFEQVVDAAPLLSGLLSACPRLRVLVTSRELLRIQGEREYEVPPLAEPDAIELFHRRSGLEPSAPIADLCARLDNLPLAVELAAARASVLSPSQILERLSQRLDLLRGGRDADPRQQTLRATIAWSHDLLDEEERMLFARLAVFRGGCTLEAATEVADATVDALQSLVDKSLVRHTDERFWQLETIREYARERLAESGLEDETRRQHAAYYLRFGEEIDRESQVGSFAEPLARMGVEYDNLRSTLEWARDADEDDVLLRVTAALGGYWSVRGLAAEAGAWVTVALARSSTPTQARIEVLRIAGKSALHEGDFARAESLIAEHRAAAEEAGNTAEILSAINATARVELAKGNRDGARELYLEVRDAAAEHGFSWLHGYAVINLGAFALEEGDFRSSLEHSTTAVDVFREDGDESGLIVALLNGGTARICLGEPARAEADFREALVVAGQVEASHRIPPGALGLGAALVATGRAEQGTALLGAWVALSESLDVPVFDDELEQRIHEQSLAAAKAALGEGAFAAAWEHGRAMTPEDVVRVAAGEAPGSAVAT